MDRSRNRTCQPASLPWLTQPVNGTASLFARCFFTAPVYGRVICLRGLPIFTFIDTPGAFPGIGAEERGQAEAIARNLREMAALTVPIIVTVTGEGGSGGALAIAVGNRVIMMQYSVYAVISPEGCAAILWSDGTRGPEAAEALKLTSMDIDALGTVIDDIISEPVGGAHNDHLAAAAAVKERLKSHLAALKDLSAEELVEQRYQKFRAMTMVSE